MPSDFRCNSCSIDIAAKPPFSPVASLLGSNATPTNAEAAVIRSAVLEAEKTLITLDIEIAFLEVALEQRRRERQAHREFRDAHNALLSPIRRLPPELLSEIFAQCLPETQPMWESGCLPTMAPLAVSAVSGHWRNVAISTHRLWSTVYMDLDLKNPDFKANIARTWFERSGNVPLSVTLLSQQHHHNTHPVIDIVTRHSNRLQFLYVNLGHSLMRALTPLKGRLPLLHTLTMHSRNREGFDDSLCDIFTDAPRLRILETFPTPRMLDIPFTQITQCYTIVWDFSECLQVLRMAPNLATCTFDGMRTPSALNHSLVISHLRSLSITEDLTDPMDLCQIFSSLSLPDVREISIELYHSYNWPMAPFMSFISRSSRQLEKLVLRRACISSDDLIRCLEAIPSLSELEFGGHFGNATPEDTFHDPRSSVNDTVIQKLTYLAGHEGKLPLAPSLHTIRLWGFHTLQDSIILDMIESRLSWTLPTGLQRLRLVRVALERKFSPETNARINVWKGKGLDVSFLTN